MKPSRVATRMLLGVACLLIIPPLRSAPVRNFGEADNTPKQVAASGNFSSLAELQAHYARQALDLERKQLADLAALAQRQSGLDAEATHRVAFDLAVGHGLYSDAEAAARAYLA